MSTLSRALALVLFVSLVAALPAQELWVSSYFGNTVNRYDALTGQSLGSVSGGSLQGPLGMTLGAGNDVYVASELTGSIEVFDRSSATWSRSFTSGTASSPTGIARDAQGNLFVTEFDKDDVVKYSPSGQLLGTVVAPGSGGLNGPDIGVTFGPDGSLYVPSFYSNAFLRFDPATGAALAPFVPSGLGGLTQPRTILWRNGVAYVSSDNGNKVIKYDATTGAFLGNLVAPGSGGLNGAVGMAFVGDSLLVTSWRNSRILRYDANTGAFQGVFASNVNSPVGLLVVPEPCTLVLGGTLLASLALRRRR